MNARLALEISVSVVADHPQGGAADTGLVVAQLIHQLGLEAVPLGPTGVSAQQHLRPVARFGAARAGLNAEKGIAGILRPAEHRPQFEIVEPLFDAGQLGCQLLFQGGILIAQLGHCQQVARGRVKLFERLEQCVQGLQLFNDLLRPLGLVPEIRLGHAAVELIAQSVLGGDVKDCPEDG